MRAGRVEVTGGCLLLLAWLNFQDTRGIVPLATVACVLHELGHFGAIRLLGGDIRRIRFTAIGGEMELTRPLGYWQEGAAALAGPGVNLLLALLACQWERGLLFSGINLVLGCFNLLPAARLDGGKALYCTLLLLLGPDAAGAVRDGLDLTFISLTLALGWTLFQRHGNVTLLLVALWLTASRLVGGEGE